MLVVRIGVNVKYGDALCDVRTRDLSVDLWTLSKEKSLGALRFSVLLGCLFKISSIGGTVEGERASRSVMAGEMSFAGTADVGLGECVSKTGAAALGEVLITARAAAAFSAAVFPIAVLSRECEVSMSNMGMNPRDDAVTKTPDRLVKSRSVGGCLKEDLVEGTNLLDVLFHVTLLGDDSRLDKHGS